MPNIPPFHWMSKRKRHPSGVNPKLAILDPDSLKYNEELKKSLYRGSFLFDGSCLGNPEFPFGVADALDFESKIGVLHAD